MKTEQLTVEALLDKFRDEMLAKLKKRAAKHPEDNILSCSMEDLINYPIKPITDHMDEEIGELFVARKFSSPSAIRVEDVDVANMAFIEWMLRWTQE